MSALRCELRLGRWEDALADVGNPRVRGGMVDALICDPPYSERTHAGSDAVAGTPNGKGDGAGRRKLGYTAWTAEDVRAFVDAWAPRVRGWMVAITDHRLVPAWEQALEARGRYVFAPLHFIAPGSRVRLQGDGPSTWSVSIVVARPRTSPWFKWGALPGGYVLPPGQHSRDGEQVQGGKPEWLMRALVRDYTRPGDLIVDPCAGGGTTLIAARAEGRHSIGAEMDPATHALASKRIGRPCPNLFGDYAP